MSTTDQPVIQLSQNDINKCQNFTDLFFNDVDKHNMQQKYGYKSRTDKIADTLQGYFGERAIGNYFNYETKFKSFNKKDYDVLGYEVRTVKYQSAILITHNDDKPGIYICVSINLQTYLATLKGWSQLDRCNSRLGNWKDGPNWHTPCFGMPENQLFPMQTLPATPELIAHQKQVA